VFPQILNDVFYGVFPQILNDASYGVFPTDINVPTKIIDKMKFKNHKQYRLPECDYSGPGNYFITINTFQKKKYFGDIIQTEDGIIQQLSEPGEAAAYIWKKIPIKFPNVMLDDFIVMPDHIHGIIMLQQLKTPVIKHNTCLHPLVKNSVSSIINHYKGAVKMWCNTNGYKDFKWQSRFYDRVIRDDVEFYFIQEYIKNNPTEWCWNMQ